MSNRLTRALFFTASLGLSAHAAQTWVVAPSGDDAAAGSAEAPFASVQKAWDVAQAGDMILLRDGVYRQNVKLTGKAGSEQAPITMKAWPGEKPVLSGLDELKLNWTPGGAPGLWVADLDRESPVQLFWNDKPLLEARWPHVPRDKNGDWDFFAESRWGQADRAGNSYGTLSSAQLRDTGMDVTGATVVLNVEHAYYCWTRTVRSHGAGSQTFTYDQDLGKSVGENNEAGTSKKQKWDDGNKFYLLGQKQFLGAPGEWYYAADEKKLYVLSPDGKAPDTAQIESKTRDWAFTADAGCAYLNLDGVTFFGTAFRFGKDHLKRVQRVTLSNCTVLYGSWSENHRPPKIEGQKPAPPAAYPTLQGDRCEVARCTFAYGALTGFFLTGFDNLIEDCVVHDFDLCSTLDYPPLAIGRNYKEFIGQGGRNKARRNSIFRSGGILFQVGQFENDCQLNDVYDAFKSCYGGNKDTSAMYTQVDTGGTRFHHNWVHDCYSGTPPLPWGGGIGIRGDDFTTGLIVDHNVVWNTGSVGIHIKNTFTPKPEDANRCVNNTVFRTSAYNANKTAILMQSSKKKENMYSTVANNLAESVFGSWQRGATSAAVNQNNLPFAPETDLVAEAWRDFRPSPDSSGLLKSGSPVEGIPADGGVTAPDLGAYQTGLPTYWIPGARDRKATFPIVPDRAEGVPANRDLLMFRPAYDAVGHRVTLATSRASLDAGDGDAVTKTLSGDENTFALAGLASGQTYFWRVDAIRADRSEVKGDVWTFRTR